MLSRRLGYAAVSGVVLVAFGLIGQLTPSPTGVGTHQQLGLSECAFAKRTGWRCPSCGVTTACCHLARGQWKQALATHVTGSAVAGGAAMGSVVLLVVAVLGWNVNRFIGKWFAPVAVIVIAIGLTEWLVRMAIERFG